MGGVILFIERKIFTLLTETDGRTDEETTIQGEGEGKEKEKCPSVADIHHAIY